MKISCRKQREKCFGEEETQLHSPFLFYATYVQIQMKFKQEIKHSVFCCFLKFVLKLTNSKFKMKLSKAQASPTAKNMHSPPIVHISEVMLYHKHNANFEAN